MSKPLTAEERIIKYGINVCPICGSVLIKKGGCKECLNCGYFACDI
jgi:hypothetical protein